MSSVDQNTIRQLEGMELDRTFTDKASGKDTNRPQLAAMLTHVREGDTVYVHSMDRLARNVDDLRKLVLDLTRRSVEIRFQKEGLTFTADHNPLSEMMLSIIGAVAQFERELIKERQREGIAAAKKVGAYKGRKRSLDDAQVEELRRRAAVRCSRSDLAREFGISRNTLYQYLTSTARPAS